MLMSEAPKGAGAGAAGDPAGAAWIDMLYYSCTETMVDPGPFLRCETRGLQSTLTRSQSQVLEFLNGASSVFHCPSPSISPPSPPAAAAALLLSSPKLSSPPPVMHPNLVWTLKSILSTSSSSSPSPSPAPDRWDGDSQSSTSDGNSSGSKSGASSSRQQGVSGGSAAETGSTTASALESTPWERHRNFKQPEAVMMPLDLIYNRRPYQCAFQGCQRTFKNPQTMRMHHKTHFNGARSSSSLGAAAAETATATTKLEPPAFADTELFTFSPIKAGHNKKIPARCPACCKTFVGLYELRRHFGRKHSEGEKRHACRKCAKRFHVEVDVRDHEKLCGEPIVCSGCGMKFAFKCNLVAHKRSRHPVCQVDVAVNRERSFQFKHQ